MAEYICIGVGTNQGHKNFLTAYATAFSLPVNECDGEYVCIGIGTGTMSQVHHEVLTAYAEQHNLTVTDSDTPCPS